MNRNKKNIFNLAIEDIRTIQELLLKADKPQLITEQKLLMKKSYDLIKVIPIDLLQLLIEFRTFGNQEGYLLIRGLPIDEKLLGLTPNVGESNIQTSSTEILLYGFSSILGEVFCFKSQYYGKLIQDLYPIKINETKQMGTGSKEFLDWHTEDAAFDNRGDFISLLCLRPDINVATTVASIRNMTLPNNVKKVLFNQKVTISLDEVHGKNDFKKKVNVFYGEFEDPFIRFDPLYMDINSQSLEIRESFKHVVNEIDRVKQLVYMKKGDLLIIDNHRIVHGRTPFSPKYDGKDRWLKRVSIVSDLKKSYHLLNDGDKRQISMKKMISEL